MTDPVVVVGAGPVGLVVATVLSRADVPVVVLEAGPGPGSASRASTFHPSTLELLDELDLVAPLRSLALVAPTFQFRRRGGEILAELDLGVLADETRFPYRLQCEQHKLCAIVGARLADAPRVDLRYGRRAVGVDPATAAVTLDDGSTVRGAWVVAADGASSALRASAGIDFEGITYPERFLVVSTEADLAQSLPGIALVNYVADDREWHVLLRSPDHWRALFPVTSEEPDEVLGKPDALAARLRDVAGHDIPVAHHSVYRIHQRIAATFRAGRLLLGGDAAHVNNPLGGMGMNSGLHDAVSLGRRLAEVLHGGSEALLDEYATRRRSFAVDLVDAETRRNRERLAEPQGWAAELAAIAGDHERVRAFLRRATLLEGMEDAL
jgi:2-polyprenyl-6-methoxyphenol hydroxylase-like FAD-dependent oxidoreductase